MNDQVKEILKKASKRIDLIATGVLVGLLCLIGMMIWRETNYILPELPDPKKSVWDRKLPIEGEGFSDIKMNEGFVAPLERLEDRYLSADPVIRNNPSARELIRVNMFDKRSAEQEQEMEAKLSQLYLRAEQYHNEGQEKEALDLIGEILDTNPKHRLSLDLKKQIEDANNPSEETPEGEGGET